MPIQKYHGIILMHLLFLAQFFLTLHLFAADYPLETVIQKGHSSDIWEVVFSPDGKMILTGSLDKTAKLWDVGTGREIRSFYGHSLGVLSVSFSPDSKTIVTGSLDETCKLWDVSTGREIRSITGYADGVTSVRFSPDGKMLLTGSYDNTVKLWDVSTGSIIRTFIGPTSPVYLVGFNPNGKTLISAYENKSVMVWDIETGQVVQSFFGNAFSISPDGKMILIPGKDSTAVKLYDISTGNEIRSFIGSTRLFILSTSFSQDGKTIITSGSDNIARLWEVSTGREIRSFTGHTGLVSSVSFSPDSETLVTGSFDETAKLWDIATGQEIRSFNGQMDLNPIAVFNPDGKTIATRIWDKNIGLWDLSSGSVIRTFTGHSGFINSITFNSGGESMLTASEDSTAKLWDVTTGSEIRSFIGHADIVSSASFSPDGKTLVTGSWDSTAKLWNVATGIEIRSFIGHSGIVYSANFSPDGKTIVTASGDSTVKLWDVATGTKIRSFNGHGERVTLAVFSLDGKEIVTGSYWDSIVKVWDVTTSREIRSFNGHINSVYSIRFSPDGKMIVTVSRDNTAILWDTATGREIRSFTGHASDVISVSFSPHSKTLATGSQDGTTKLWDVNTGKEITSLISIGKNDWAVSTREGLFDCSEGAKKYIHFVKGTQIYELDQFFEDFYRPGLLAEVMSGKEVKRPDIGAAEKLTQSPPPSVQIISPKVSEMFSQAEIEIVVEVTDNGGGIDETVLLHNGKRVPEDTRGFQVLGDNKNSFTREYKITLLNGENVFRASAFSKGRIESRGHELTILFKQVSAMANSYIFVIGIDQYQNSKYNLNFARADAAGVKDLIVKKSSHLFENTFVHELYNSDASSFKIKSIFNEILPKIQPQDVFTFFYAGHGVMVADETGKEQFYIIPAEVTSMFDEDKVRQSGITGKQLVQFSQNIAARKQLFIFDACQAGGISDDFAMNRGFAEEKALAQLARSAGIHVIASSQSDQYASEFSELGHGLFTYALIQAMNGKAEAPPPDGKITIREINVYLENVIPDLARKYKGQAQYPVIYSKGQDFPVVVE